MLDLKRRVGTVARTALAAVRAFVARDDVTYAASLAFYTSLSFGPMVILMLTLTGAVGPELQKRFVEQLGTLIGPEADRALHLVIENAKQDGSGGPGALVGFVLLAFSATGVFAELQSSLNLIWEVKSKPGLNIWAWIRKRILSIGILLAIGFLLAVTLVLNVMVSSVLPDALAAWRILDVVLSLAVFTLLFGLMYWWLPDAKVKARCVWPGAVTAAVLFSATKYGIGLYLGGSPVASAYGAAGAVVVLLVWAWISSIVFLFGAELARVCALRHDRAMPPPEDGIAERDERAALPEEGPGPVE